MLFSQRIYIRFIKVCFIARYNNCFMEATTSDFERDKNIYIYSLDNWLHHEFRETSPAAATSFQNVIF